MAIVGYSNKKPGSYVERVQSASAISTDKNFSVTGFIGITPRGEDGKAIKITSWKGFIQKFARGFDDDPFIKGTFALEVFDFFDNGGSELYISRLVSSTSTKATVQIVEGLNAVALDKGDWANNLELEITENNVVIRLNTKEVEAFDITEYSQVVEIVNAQSNFIRIEGSGTISSPGKFNLATGKDGAIQQADYLKALSTFNIVNDVNMLAIPNTGEAVQLALFNYCKGTRIIPMLDSPEFLEDKQELIDYRKKFEGFNGAVYYPHQIVLHPIDGETKLTISSIGAVCGIASRMEASEGIHKAPAGLKATLVNAVGLTDILSDTDCGILNKDNVNCIVPKQGTGIVIWGARMVQPNLDRKYVSDLRLDNFIEDSIEKGTEWVVFEPIGDSLFSDVQSNVSEFLRTLWQEGKLRGSSPEDAFYVKCDSELNNDPNAGHVEIEVGYAKKKPAEFVVTRISHKQV